MSHIISSMILMHAALSMLVVGCAAPRLPADITTSRPPLPSDLRNRQLYEHTHYFKYDLAELAGTILVAPSGETDSPSRGPRLVPPQYSPPVTLIQDGVLYTAKIDRAAAAEGSVLAFASSLAASELVEVVFQDVARAFVPSEKIPTQELLRWAMAYAETGVTASYAQGVVLSTVQKSYYDEVDSSMALSGDIFRGSGRVYSRRQALSRDFQIAVEPLDLQEFLRLTPHSVAFVRNRAGALAVNASSNNGSAETPNVEELADHYGRAIQDAGDDFLSKFEAELTSAIRGAAMFTPASHPVAPL